MYAAVRVRGPNSTRRNASETMNAMHLTRKHNCMLLSETDANQGMLQQAKDFIAYGPVSTETVTALLQKRGRVNGGRLDGNTEQLGFDTIDELVSALEDGETTLSELRNHGLKVPFRLSPPSKGFNDSKRHYRQGGSLGNRDDMDALLKRMM